MIADIGGNFTQGVERGRQNLSRDLVGNILASTFGGKLGNLGSVNPEAAMSLAKGLGIPANEKERLQSYVGDIQAATAIANGSSIQDAKSYLMEVADRRSQLGIESPKLKAMIDFMDTDPEGAIDGLNTMTGALVEQGFLKGESKKPERVKANEVINGMVITDDGNGNFSRTRVSAAPEPSEEVLLKREEVRMRIEDRSAAAEAKRITAVEAAEQKDSKAVSSVFESQTALDNLDALLKDDAYKAIYGTGDAFLPTLRADSITLEAQRDQVVDLLGLESREKLKGSGTISDSESAALARSATILGNPGISEPAALKEINRVRDVFSRSRDRNLKNPEAKRLLRESLTAGTAPAVATQAEFDALPPGALYTEDGQQYRKP
jgi:hypothetical protein